MPVLAIDTATLVSSVAVAEENTLLAELTLQTRLTHSEVLMPHIKEILKMVKLQKQQLGGIAVSVGPGSFTGLRIGLATAKTLAYALQIPLVGVSTLAALAYNCQSYGSYIVPTLDAQRGNVYAAVYEWEGQTLKELYKPHVIALDALLEKARAADRPALLLGEGAVKRRAAVLSAGGSLQLACPHSILPRASSVALLGCKRLAAKAVDDAMRLEPYYIRRSEAEVLWEKRHGK